MTSPTAEFTKPSGPAMAPRPRAIRPAVPLFRELDRGPLVLDAAMATRLCENGLDLRVDDPCLWNLNRPEAVLDLHRRDVLAGSRVILTNTFGANRSWLARLGRRGDVEAINRAGVALARRAIGPSDFVAGDIGPSVADEPGAAAEQGAMLIEAGVDALILETFRLETAIAVLSELRSSPGSPSVPLIVGLWQWPESAEDAARCLVDSGADAIGLNCRPAMGGVLPLVRRIAGAVDCPLLVKPGISAGDPQDGSTPAAFAAAVPALIESNVRLIGGCCGTTEAHIGAIAAACAALAGTETQEFRGTRP